MIDVFLGEKFIGKIENKDDLIKKVKEERRRGKLPSTININYNKQLNEINIEIANGRVRRPVIVVENGVSKLTEEILIEYCRQNLASFKRPKSVEFMQELPRNILGKVEKNKLKEKFWKGHARKIN